MKRQRYYSGFTLIEALVYTVVLSIIVGSISASVLMIFRNKTVIEDRIRVNEDLRLLVKSIRDDMYVGGSFTINVDGSLFIESAVNGQDDITYFESGDQVFRQEEGEVAVALTSTDTDVRAFTVEDISSPSAAGTIRLTLELSNFPRGTLKPEVVQWVTSTISLKYL